jgi:hypothetical protein
MNEFSPVSSVLCDERHKNADRQQLKNESDIKEIWSKVGEVQASVSSLSNKIAYTVGTITMLVNVVFLLLNYLLAGQAGNK